MVDYRKFDHIGSDSEDDETLVDPAVEAEEKRQLQLLRSRFNPAASSSATASSVSAEVHDDLIPPEPTARATTSLKHKNRFRFEHNHRLIYEWEQNLTEVILYIPTPPGISKKNQFDIRITAHHLVVALTGASQYYLDEDTGGPIIKDESTWFLDENDDYDPSNHNSSSHNVVINLQKMYKAQAWSCALKGNNNHNKNTNNNRNNLDANGNPIASGELDALTQEEVKKQLMRERFQEEHPGFDFSDADFNGQVPDAREFMGGVRYG